MIIYYIYFVFGVISFFLFPIQLRQKKMCNDQIVWYSGLNGQQFFFLFVHIACLSFIGYIFCLGESVRTKFGD